MTLLLPGCSGFFPETERTIAPVTLDEVAISLVLDVEQWLEWLATFWMMLV